ncbi:MAG: glycosyltransferase family 2 protein [Gemmatimonadaceae bacterium]|nr:glycosyltransferase family 2 protein [Chitinophagaceae bacterium]
MVSIIIVSYNVRSFLEQCLFSVTAAVAGLDSEVIVVDNYSSDDTVKTLETRFPLVKFVAAGTNLGYSKANNLGWKMSRGEVVLFLNPDTLLGEGAVKSSLQILEDKEVGAVGVRMVDGRGVFLRESKRGFPSPGTSFFKMAGFANFFPKSGIFARYYLGHLPEKKVQDVEVLSGAFMMVRRQILVEHGGFDEDFFMYGEDVDLSYRIMKAGFRNVYNGMETIVHFKGESTQKNAFYTFHFYNAMRIFVKKHYGEKSRIFSDFLGAGIWMKKLVAGFGKRGAKRPVRGQVSVALLGSEAERLEAQAILESDSKVKRVYLPDGKMVIADEWVVCVGRGSWREAIVGLERSGRHFRFRFHAAGSGSIVGSDSSNHTGTYITILSGNA